MLEVLQSLIQQHGEQAVVNNSDVPNQHNDDVKDEIMNGLLSGLSNQASAQGGLGSLMGLLGNNSNAKDSNSLMSNPIVAMIAQNVMGSLMQKFGMSNNAASGVVGSMLPSVLGGLISRTNDPNDNGIDMGSILGVLSGGKTQGLDLGSIMSGVSGAMADGKLDMNDLINLASGKSNQPQQQQSGGSLLGNVLGGLFGK